MSNLLFTPSSVFDLLSQISELSDYEIGIDELEDGVRITIDDSEYTLRPETEVELEVDKDDIEAIDEMSEDTYESVENGDRDVQAGPIKELVKTLMLGGMVRLSAKMLK